MDRSKLEKLLDHENCVPSERLRQFHFVERAASLFAVAERSLPLEWPLATGLESTFGDVNARENLERLTTWRARCGL